MQYRLIILIVILTVTAVLIKGFSRNTFRYDAVKNSEASVSGTNIISPDQLNKLPGNFLIINLDGSRYSLANGNINERGIPADSILYKSYKKFIFNYKGSIILKSDEQYKSAGVWMVLSQMGMKNVFILN
jgi:hypothetical protein